MKLLKSIPILVFIFLSVNANASHSSQNTAVNVDSSKILTQEVLLKLSLSNELSQIYFPIDKVDMNEKRHIFLAYKNDYFTFKLECKLLCVSEKGIFIYKDNTISFIPYKQIKFIQRGIPFGKQLAIATSIGGGVGFLVGLTDSSWPILMGVLDGILGAGGTAFYYCLIGGPINFIASLSDNIRAKIDFNEENGARYRRKVIEQETIYGDKMQVKDYPSFSQKSSSKPIVPQDNKDTISLANEKSTSSNANNEDNIVIKNDGVEIFNSNQDAEKNTQQSKTVEIPKSIKDSVVLEPVKSTPPQLKVEFPNLNNAKGKINPQWMYLSYNKLDVNEKKLMAKFKNIQGTQMIAENLQNLNPSEIQFLAITIATLNGYNFRNIVSFSESQAQNLKNYESYISNEIKADSEIDPSNLQELDLDNIKLIYSVLKAKMN